MDVLCGCWYFIFCWKLSFTRKSYLWIYKVIVTLNDEIPNVDDTSIALLKQASLAAAKNSLGAADTTGRPGKPEGSPSPHYYDSDDATSMDTPAGCTPISFSNSFGVGANGEVNGSLSLLSHLTMEFEQRKQNFDNEAMAIVHLKPGQLHSTNPADEYRRLKHRFEEWKKEYKARLKETKTKVHKLVHSKAGKTRRKWWGRKSK